MTDLSLPIRKLEKRVRHLSERIALDREWVRTATADELPEAQEALDNDVEALVAYSAALIALRHTSDLDRVVLADLVVYGLGVVKRRADGTFERVDPTKVRIET